MNINKIIGGLMLMSLAVFMSCSDDVEKSPLEETVAVNDGVSFNTLSFKWDKVEGATQYGYEFYKGDDDLLTRDVTTVNHAEFNGLDPDTEYTLKVWAYSAIGGDNTSSPAVILKATTRAFEKIGTPELRFELRGGDYVILWDKVDKAESYTYSLVQGDNELKSGNVTSTYVKFSGLEQGDYVIKVTANTSEYGYYNGDPAELTFNVSRSEIWRAKGIYNSAALGEKWSSTLVAYSDGTYSLLGWYGVEGYNLDFWINKDNADDMFSVTGDYEYDEYSYCYIVPTGRNDNDIMYLYQWYNYCSLSGDATSGVLTLCVYGSTDYVNDTFVWGPDVKDPADSFVGTWNVSLSGMTCITDDWSEQEFSYNETIEITKVNFNTIEMPAMYFSGEKMRAKIDMDNKTLTVDPMTVWEYYTLAGSENANAKVIGHINDDGSFEFNDWYAWYDGYTYIYESKAKYWK